MSCATEAYAIHDVSATLNLPAISDGVCRIYVIAQKRQYLKPRDEFFSISWNFDLFIILRVHLRVALINSKDAKSSREITDYLLHGWLLALKKPIAAQVVQCFVFLFMNIIPRIHDEKTDEKMDCVHGPNRLSNKHHWDTYKKITRRKKILIIRGTISCTKVIREKRH